MEEILTFLGQDTLGRKGTLGNRGEDYKEKG